jgi:hypothetical protein
MHHQLGVCTAPPNSKSNHTTPCALSLTRRPGGPHGAKGEARRPAVAEAPVRGRVPSGRPPLARRVLRRASLSFGYTGAVARFRAASGILPCSAPCSDWSGATARCPEPTCAPGPCALFPAGGRPPGGRARNRSFHAHPASLVARSAPRPRASPPGDTRVGAESAARLCPRAPGRGTGSGATSASCRRTAEPSAAPASCGRCGSWEEPEPARAGKTPSGRPHASAGRPSGSLRPRKCPRGPRWQPSTKSHLAFVGPAPPAPWRDCAHRGAASRAAQPLRSSGVPSRAGGAGGRGRVGHPDLHSLSLTLSPVDYHLGARSTHRSHAPTAPTATTKTTLKTTTSGPSRGADL